MAKCKALTRSAVKGLNIIINNCRGSAARERLTLTSDPRDPVSIQLWPILCVSDDAKKCIRLKLASVRPSVWADEHTISKLGEDIDY